MVRVCCAAGIGAALGIALLAAAAFVVSECFDTRLAAF